MPFALKITSDTAGDFDFTAIEVPLFSRRVAYNRIGADQGPSLRRIDCVLTGYFRGNKNDEIMAQIESLIAILKSNQITLHYNDGVRDIVNRKVWVADYNDPNEWKQYIGNYNIGFYYFETADETAGETITASWVTDSGTYTFTPSPAISHAAKANRSNHRQNRTTPAGVVLGDTVQITLEGFLKANSPAELETERQALINAFAKDGTLNYGTFSQSNVRVVQRNIPQVFPLDHLAYTIELVYETNFEIAEFEASRTFSRVHAYPIIRDRPYCGSPTVTLLSTSGQTISYNFKIAGLNRDNIRSLLANEAAALVYGGGVELPGGQEVWSENDASIAVSFTKFYPTPVLFNLPGT